jgi:putative sterol carrier protein
MAVQFLSQEWADAMTQALNSSEEFTAAASHHDARVQQVVTGGPDGDSRYYFIVDGGVATIGLGEVEEAEATVTQSYETAVAISRRDLPPQQAFMQGKLKINGNVMKLLQLQGVLSALAKAVSGLEVDYQRAPDAPAT